jgi:hypothetical protein
MSAQPSELVPLSEFSINGLGWFLVNHGLAMLRDGHFIVYVDAKGKSSFFIS